ncbi:MAG TPA: hypothetical protein VGA99_09225 [bacterium]
MRKKHLATFASLLLVILYLQNAFGQNYLFDEPRQGGFKFIPNDHLDITHAMHYTGSGMLARGFYNLYQSRGMKHPKLWAGLTACSIGLLKEYEDAYRTGWGRIDTIFNQLGIISFLMLKDYTRYSITVEEVVTADRQFGVGIRFFRSEQFSPLRASVGLFGYYDTHNDVWFGIDSHFWLIGRTELHTGITLFKLQEPNRPHVQPTAGFAFRLY